MIIQQEIYPNLIMYVPQKVPSWFSTGLNQASMVGRGLTPSPSSNLGGCGGNFHPHFHVDGWLEQNRGTWVQSREKTPDFFSADNEVLKIQQYSKT